MANVGVFPQQLKKAMAHNQLANKDALAAFLGVWPTRVGPWVNGKRLPDGDGLLLLGEKLGVSLDWLLLGRGPMDPPKNDVYAQGVGETTDRVLRLVGEIRKEIGLEWPREWEELAPQPPAPVPPPEPEGPRET